MKHETIYSFEQFHNFVCGEDTTHHIYRGVSDSDKHKLVPSIGRVTNFNRTHSNNENFELSTFQSFKEKSIRYLNYHPSSELEWLSLAQHHGLPTRLLDWTYNPIVALYFAIEKLHPKSSAVYIYMPTEQTLDISCNIDPFNIDRNYTYRPSRFDSRIEAQHSVFTIHEKPQEIMGDTNLVAKLVIPIEIQAKLKKVIRKYGIRRSSLFPGLDGLALEISERLK